MLVYDEMGMRNREMLMKREIGNEIGKKEKKANK